MKPYYTLVDYIDFLYEKVFKGPRVEIGAHSLLHYNFCYFGGWYSNNLSVKVIRL